MISIFLNLPRLVLWSSMWSTWRMFHDTWKEYILLFLLDEMLYKYQLSSSGLVYPLRSVSFIDFLSGWSIDESGGVKVSFHYYCCLFLPLCLFSRSAVSDTLQPHESQHARPLSITNSWSSLILMSIESVMPSSHLIFCHSLLLLPPIPPSIRVFSNVSTLRMRWPKY